MDIATLKGRVDIVSVVAAYRKLTKQGDEYLASCVWHAPDNSPSMSVIPGKGFAYCHACGCHGDIIDIVCAAEGLAKHEAIRKIEQTTYATPKLVPSRRKPLGGRETGKPPPGNEPNFTLDFLGGEPTLVHVIRDLDGSVLGYEAIYYVGGKKEPRLWTWGRRGNLPFSWGLGNFHGFRALFGLETLAKEGTVFVSEGPKKALAIGAMLSSPSVSITNGANSWHRHDWAPLRGRKVLLWPDSDTTGIEAFKKLGLMLVTLDCRTYTLSVPADGNGWDAADAYAEGWNSIQCMAWCRERLVRVER